MESGLFFLDEWSWFIIFYSTSEFGKFQEKL